MENNTPAAPATNVFEQTQCTARAADFWKRMTGRYPNWRDSTGRYGNAGYWDDNAGATGWLIEGVPMADSLAIWQPTSTNKAGHVGYVADTRVSNGILQMKIYDRNFDFRGTNRNGVWLNYASGMKFIVVPPHVETVLR
jgi:surface antigen